MKTNLQTRKKLLPVVGFLIFVAFILSGFKKIPEAKSAEERLDFHKKEVQKVLDNNSNYNKEFAFFIDMGIESGKYRFFIYNMKTNTIIGEGLVTHGFGSDKKSNGMLKFSNINNSLCTSLGKYSIGIPYIGSYGKAYKLHGLDETNSNAFDRNIVLHKMLSIPNQEQNGAIEKSFGCPAVSEQYFEKLANIIDQSETNIILSIYY